MPSGMPLAGVRVLGFCGGRAGTFCGSALSDLGAEFIVVEFPHGPDTEENAGVGVDGACVAGADGFAEAAAPGSAEWAVRASEFRGKKSVELDPRTPSGSRVIVDLAAACDAVVDDLGPGILDGLGLGPAALRGAKPGLVYASISAFGKDGPPSFRGADELLAQAASGVLSSTGWPGSPPTQAGAPLGEYSAAMAACAGICAALFDRAKSGAGRTIDIAIADCLAASERDELARFRAEGRAPSPIGSRDRDRVPFQAFRAADGWLAVAVGDDKAWKAFCGATGRLDLYMDGRFSGAEARLERYDELLPELERVFETRSRAEWRRLLDLAGVPCAPVLGLAELDDEPGFRARNAFVAARHLGRSATVPGNPLKMDGVPERLAFDPAPAPGEHTEAVLRELLGLGGAAIAALKADRAIRNGD